MPGGANAAPAVGGAKRKWVWTDKRRSWGGRGGGESGSGRLKDPREGAVVAGQQSDGFVRDFIRGAGIHRLDPRRLSGELGLRAG